MNLETQISIMRTQLSAFNGIGEKLYYLTMFFGPDPEFSEEAKQVIRADLSKKREEEK